MNNITIKNGQVGTEQYEIVQRSELVFKPLQIDPLAGAYYSRIPGGGNPPVYILKCNLNQSKWFWSYARTVSDQYPTKFDSAEEAIEYMIKLGQNVIYVETKENPLNSLFQ